MNEEQIKDSIKTIQALVEAQENTDSLAKIGAAAALLLLESFLINQYRQTIALEQLAGIEDHTKSEA